MNIALPKNDVDPIAWPLGKLNPDISINRIMLSALGQNILQYGFNILERDITITKNSASILKRFNIKYATNIRDRQTIAHTSPNLVAPKRIEVVMKLSDE